MSKNIVAWIVDPFIEFSQRICKRKKCVPSRVSTVLSDRDKKERIACCKMILKDVSLSKSDVYCVRDQFLFTKLQQDSRALEYGNKDELFIGAKRFLRLLPEDYFVFLIFYQVLFYFLLSFNHERFIA